jgi:hypothetical protein
VHYKFASEKQQARFLRLQKEFEYRNRVAVETADPIIKAVQKAQAELLEAIQEIGCPVDRMVNIQDGEKEGVEAGVYCEDVDTKWYPDRNAWGPRPEEEKAQFRARYGIPEPEKKAETPAAAEQAAPPPTTEPSPS